MDQIEMDQEQEQQQNTEQAENALEDFVDPASVVSLPVNMKVGYIHFCFSTCIDPLKEFLEFASVLLRWWHLSCPLTGQRIPPGK